LIDRSTWQDDTLIKVTLDDGAGPYFVPKALLCAASDYFVTALKQETFSEGNTRDLCLPGCDDETLAYFLHWLTYRTLPSQRSHVNEHKSSQDCQHCHSAMIKLWAFGDAYFLPKVQSLAMSWLTRLCTEIPMPATDAKMAFELTAVDSKLRTLVTRFMAYYVATGDWEDSETLNIAGSVPGFFQYFVKQEFMPAAQKEMPYECFAPDSEGRSIYGPGGQTGVRWLRG